MKAFAGQNLRAFDDWLYGPRAHFHVEEVEEVEVRKGFFGGKQFGSGFSRTTLQAPSYLTLLGIGGSPGFLDFENV